MLEDEKSNGLIYWQGAQYRAHTMTAFFLHSYASVLDLSVAEEADGGLIASSQELSLGKVERVINAELFDAQILVEVYLIIRLCQLTKASISAATMVAEFNSFSNTTADDFNSLRCARSSVQGCNEAKEDPLEHVFVREGALPGPLGSFLLPFGAGDR